MAAKGAGLAPERHKYAVVGTGHRAKLYINALTGPHKDRCQLVALCDPSRVRMGWHASRASAAGEVPAMYQPHEFERMLGETKPETVIVTCVDSFHERYIVAALEHGINVVTEKPIAVNVEQLRSVIEAEKASDATVKVTFNARYAQEFGALRRLVQEGCIGKVHLVELAEVLDISHGADYFRRWHRERQFSGGLLVHKACHHFDLVNWWVGSSPKTVYAVGSLSFYGQANAALRGESYSYGRYTGEPAASSDPFSLVLDGEGTTELRELYLDAEAETGYIRDQNVFSGGIDIEDSAAVSVRYHDGSLLSYTLVSYSPWEGMNVTLTGDRGRIELSQRLFKDNGRGRGRKECEVRVFPMFGKPQTLDFGVSGAGHTSEDAAITEALFGEEKVDPLSHPAFLADGVWATLIGIAAEHSIGQGRPIDCEQFVGPEVLGSKADDVSRTGVQ